MPRWGASNEYPQHTFLWRTGENYPIIITKYSSLTIPLWHIKKKTTKNKKSFFCCFQSTCIYPKYSTISSPYHTCPIIWTSTIYYIMFCLHCLSSGKQCRLWWDVAFCSVSSGSTLFAQACLSKNILGCWVRQRCRESCVTRASNWYCLIVGQGLLSLQQVRVEGNVFYFLCFFIFLFLPCPSLSSPLLSLLYLFSLSQGDDTKWPTRVDMSLNPNTINLMI